MLNYIFTILILIIYSNIITTKTIIPDISDFCEIPIFKDDEINCEKFIFENDDTFLINKELFPTENISIVKFKNCELPKITEQLFDIFPNIIELQIHNCNITKINYDLIQTPPNIKLQILILTNNKIETLQNNISDYFPDLKEINFSGNNIKNIKQLSFDTIADTDNYGLINISLSNNKITAIRTYQFSMPTLEILDLSENYIEYLDESYFSYNLQYLYLNKNKIKSIENIFNNLTKLRVLDLSDNLIEYIPAHSFSIDSEINGECINLKLRNNKIKIINEYAFVGIRCNFALDISFNKLTNFYIIYWHSSIIDFINLTGNNIKNIYVKDYLIGTRVNLILKNNTINNMEALALIKNSIEALDLSGSEIGVKIQEFESTTLKTLNLSSTNLQNLNFKTFLHMKKLEILDLSNNQLQKLDADVLYPLHNLNTLFLDGNNLKEIDYEDGKLITNNLKNIGLTRNQWNCTYLQKMIRYLNKIDITYIIPDNHNNIGDKNIGGIGCFNTENESKIDLNDIDNDKQLISKLLETNKAILHSANLSNIYTLLTFLIILIIFVAWIGQYFWKKFNKTGYESGLVQNVIFTK